MNSDNSLEDNFQENLSFLDQLSDEISAEDVKLEEIYVKTVAQLPIINSNYSNSLEQLSGGMKHIDKVWDKAAARNIAIASPKSTTLSLRDKVIFLNEARITALLEHPNIIPVYEVGRDDKNTPLFVMKWLDGMSLEKCLKSQDSASISELLNAMIKVCEAIEFAHANCIVHLDLKPANIQLGSFGEVLVLDWGLARRLHTGELTEEELMIHDSIESFLESRLRGTVEYITPEHKDGHSPSPAMDIFAIGKIIRDILQAGDKKLNSSDYTSIESISLKAASINTADRYNSVSQLKADIFGFLQGQAVAAENPSFLKLTKLFIKRHKPVFITASLALVALIVSVSIFIANLQKSELSERQSRLIAVKTLEDLEKENEIKRILLSKLSAHVANQQRLQQRALNFGGAIKNLEYLTALNSSDPDVWHQLTRLKLGSLKFDEASTCMQKAIKLGSRQTSKVNKLNSLIKTYRDKKSWSKADYLNFFKDANYEYIQATLCDTIYPKMTTKEQLEFFIEAIYSKYSSQMAFEHEVENNKISLDFSKNTKPINFSAATALPIKKLVLSQTRGNSLTFFQKSNIWE
ncbi:MAG: serine/threonine protein kinase, partial [Lentisphaeraceae bacterium]|nr:serine/threonine protein kinase [Lentisphaeraceae bacterium]